MRPSVLLLAFAAACGGGDDSMSTPDAAAVTPDANNSAQCLIKGNYGALGALTGTATMGTNTLSITLDPGPPRDSFFIKLTAGKGAFASGLAPGTYTIAGADASYLDCGLCVHIIADIVAGSGPSKFYFADAGSVTLTSTGPVAGSATNLHLSEVDINSGTKIPGCEATIASVMFSTM
jgi:hypothetical protein